MAKTLYYTFCEEWGSGSVSNRYVSESELRTRRVTIQVSVNEKDLLITLAKKEGLSISDYIRKRCIYDKVNELIRNE